MDRKYSHRGYRDGEKNEKKERPPRPPIGGPKGVADHLGPRTPRMVGTVTRARCSNCGAVLAPGFDPQGKCPKCGFELHCCKQCRYFDSGEQFECVRHAQLTERITPKDTKNNCKLYEFRMTVEKDTAPTSYSQPSQAATPEVSPSRPMDARQAFENLFKK